MLTHAEARAALPVCAARDALGHNTVSGITNRGFPCARPRPDVAVETRGAARVGFVFFQTPQAAAHAAKPLMAPRSADWRSRAAAPDDIMIQGTRFAFAAVTCAHLSCTARSKA